MMEISIQLLKLSAGIGMFLFAMYLLQESLKNISGRNFKIFLQRIAKNNIGAVIGGAIVTGVLQSSSMVSLMVLAFLGAGVFTMKNAMAIILGANLGTTCSSWLIATLGFKVNIEVAAYPAVCMGGLLLIVSGHRKSVKYSSFFLLGFGLLFIGLSFMKAAMEAQVKAIDFAKYGEMPLLVFLLIGFGITLLIQSSSATMALTLSALHSGAIGFVPAAAVVLGAETGTTIKILLGAIGGNVSKKRVALGNFLFNIVLTAIIFVLLTPTLLLVTDIFHIQDPLIGLATFSSFINLIGIFIFLLLLNPFVTFLEKFYKETDASAAAFISHANSNEPETALDLFRRETAYFIHNSMLFNLNLFEIDTRSFQEPLEFKQINDKRNFFSKTPEEQYLLLKQLQGELQVFYLKLRTKLQDEQHAQLSQLISSVRSAMHAVKSIKDIGSNIADLRRSSKNIKFVFFMHHKKEVEALYLRLHALMTEKQHPDFETCRRIYDETQANYTASLNNFYKEVQHAHLEDMDITTVINFNRELFTSNKAMLMATKDFLLDEKQAEEFNELVVYTT